MRPPTGRFIEIYYDRLKALYDFIEGRLDEAGYVCQRPGDWIFIDWSDMDKGGDLCAEQILFGSAATRWQRCPRCAAGTGAATAGRRIACAAASCATTGARSAAALVDCYTTGKGKHHAPRQHLCDSV